MADDPRDIPSTNDQQTITRQQLAGSHVSHYARSLNMAMICGGANSASQHADMIAYSYAVGSHSRSRQLESCLHNLKVLEKNLSVLHDAVSEIRDQISDADTCYRDPTLSNDGFDALPEWARTMISESSED